MTLVQFSESACVSRFCVRYEQAVLVRSAFHGAGLDIFEPFLCFCSVLPIHCLAFLSGQPSLERAIEHSRLSQPHRRKTIGRRYWRYLRIERSATISLVAIPKEGSSAKTTSFLFLALLTARDAIDERRGRKQ